VEIGRTEHPNGDHSGFQSGQFFVHRSLGYRGVIVDRWNVSVFSYPSSSVSAKSTFNTSNLQTPANASRNAGTYYQVFCDARDLVEAERKQGVHMWEHNSGLQGGVDYIDTNDIIPYYPLNNKDFRNGLFSLYFRRDSFWGNESSNSIKKNAKSILTSDYSRWEHYHGSLVSQSNVYRMKTEDVQVTVIPFLSQVSQKESDLNQWVYQVTIENHGKRNLQLVSRSWEVQDEHGQIQPAVEENVTGLTPVLSTRRRAFQYISQVTLASPVALMGGSLDFIELNADGTHAGMVSCTIPTFQLRRPAQKFEECSYEAISDVRRSLKAAERIVFKP
jgi:uncharacterized protein affecting Mg2+/Co2+ transport